MINFIHPYVPIIEKADIEKTDKLVVKTILEQLTLFDLLLIGIPVAIVVTILSTLFCFLMTSHVRRYYKQFIQIGCYTVAFQAVVALALILTLLGIAYGSMDKYVKFILCVAVILLTPAVILWPGSLYARTVTRLLPNDHIRIKRKLPSRFLSSSSALVICAITLAINLYFVIPGIPESIAQIADSHMEAVILQDQTIAETNHIDSRQETLPVLLSNPNKFQCILKASTFRHVKGDEGDIEEACYKIIDHGPRPQSLIFISPNESVLILGEKVNCLRKNDNRDQQPRDKTNEDRGEKFDRIEFELILSSGINYQMEADVNYEWVPIKNPDNPKAD